jgi:hypothetical protein
MTTANKPIFPPWLEWEFLQEGYEIENPTIEQPLPGDPHLLKIWRNDEYKIEAEISGQPRSFTIDAEKKDNAGKIVPASTMKGENSGGVKYELTGFISGDVEVQHQYLGGLDKGSFKSTLSLHEVKIIQQEDVPVERLTEWYINGISAGFILFRSTSRRIDGKYSLEREVLKTKTEEFDTGGGEYHSRDYAFINFGDFSFIIHTVPNQFGPQWSKNIGIEYRQEFGRIPTQEERIAISEIVSFILGKHLLKVGYTSYDHSGIPIENVAVNPWGDNVKHLSQSPAVPPIEIDRLAPTGKIETVLPPLIKKYIELRNPLRLNEVLWRYWIGSELSLGSNIPIMANGIEILIEYWFKSQNSRLKGVYLPKKEFDALTEDAFKIIETNLGERPFKEKIMNKLRDCFKMSLTDRLKFFFEEIGLPLGKTEQEAIRCRHKMIHSSVEMGSAKIEKMVQLSFAYRCLVHRILLKILGYDGKYIDYSIIGHPEKKIDSVVGQSDPGM